MEKHKSNCTCYIHSKAIKEAIRKNLNSLSKAKRDQAIEVAKTLPNIKVKGRRIVIKF
jgi:hypothetical protein